MPTWLIAALFGLFAIHLLAFATLAARRRQAYYWLLVLLFLALTLSFGLRLWLPEAAAAGRPLWLWLRWAGWAVAAVTLPMLVLRLRRRCR